MTYFCTPGPDLEGELHAKLKKVSQDSRLSAMRSLWEASQSYWLAGLDTQSSAFLASSGSRGQGIAVRVNEWRALVNAWASLVNNTPTSIAAGTSSTDPEALAAAIVGTQLLEHEWAQGLESACRETIELACAFGEHAMHFYWDRFRGDVVARDPNGVPYRTGAPRFELVPPWRTFREPSAQSYGSSSWVAVEVFRPKYDLAKEFPEFETDIEGATSKGIASTSSWARSEDDHCAVVYFYHDQTPAMPDGLEAVMLSGGKLLYQGALRTPRLPVARIAVSDMPGLAWGYTPAFDALGTQELLDNVWSGMATSVAQLAKPIISAETNSEVDSDSLGDDGPMVLYRAPGTQPPVPVQFSSLPAGSDKFLANLRSAQKGLVAMSDTAMGVPQTAQMNASAFSILVSSSVMQSSGLLRRARDFIKSSCEVVLDLYRTEAHMPRTISVIGKSQEGQASRAFEVSADILVAVDSVEVTLASALSATPAGRLELARARAELTQQPLTAEDFESILETGKPTKLLEKDRAENQLLAFEERELRQGHPVEALFSDQHLTHGRHHGALLCDPAVRASPDAVDAIVTHVRQHMTLLETTDPQIVALMNGSAPPPKMPGPPPPGPPGAPTVPPPPMAGGLQLAPAPTLPEGTPEQFSAPPPGLETLQ